MEWIKTICAFLITFFGLCMIAVFGYVGIFAVKEIFSYLFTHCRDLMWYTIFFILGLGGVVFGFGIFCEGADKLKK